MTDSGVISIILIIINVLVSYKGFNDSSFFERYKFDVSKVLVNKEYKRLVTSGFLHVGWGHLLFNMLSLYFFSGSVEAYLGSLQFLVVYFASLVGGNLLSLFIHRNHSGYDSVGASGAVCGVMFASISLFPGMDIRLFILPAIPAWIYGIVFVLYSIYGIRSKKDNIGHEAHLGGALIGMLVALLMQPSAFTENYVTILIIAVPAIVFIYIIITRPHILLIDNFYFKNQKDFYSIDHKYNAEKRHTQEEIDAILDKISRKGMSSLSQNEKDKLKRYSKMVK